MKTFANFSVLGQFAKVLTAKISIKYGGVIINGRVIIVDNGNSIGIMDVASHSLARQHLSNSSFPNRHIDMVASISGRHYVAL